MDAIIAIAIGIFFQILFLNVLFTSYLKNKSRHLLENITYTGDGLNK